MSVSLAAAMFLAAQPVSISQQPDCSGPQRWAARMAFQKLKNASLTDNSKIDYDKTEVELLASERIGDDLYRQVHLITFTEKTGKRLTVITKNDASTVECSMSEVDVYLVSKYFNSF